MAASHQVLLSPSTYICVGVPLSLEVTCEEVAMVTPLYLHFAHICSFPALLSIGTYPPFRILLIDKLNGIINNHS